MIVIAESRNLRMSEVLAHPVGPLPWTLAKSDGTLRKTNKASLAKELQKNVQAADVVPQTTFSVDGMALVQRLKGDQETRFAEIAEPLLSRIDVTKEWQKEKYHTNYHVRRSPVAEKPSYHPEWLNV